MISHPKKQKGQETGHCHTGTSSQKISLPTHKHLLHGLPKLQAKWALLQGRHAEETFASSPAFFDGGVEGPLESAECGELLLRDDIGLLQCFSSTFSTETKDIGTLTFYVARMIQL